MIGLFKPISNSYSIVESDVVFNESLELCDFFSEYEHTTSPIILDHLSESLMVDEVIFECMCNYDYDNMLFLNEGVIGSIVNIIRKIIGAAWKFLRTLVVKMENFLDQFSKNNAAWVSKYKNRVLERVAYSRTFTYTGHKWNLKYCTGAPYPDLKTDIDKMSKGLIDSMSEYHKLLNTNSSASDFAALEKKLTDSFPKGMNASVRETIKTKLGFPIEELTTKYLEKGMGTKIEIQAFRVISPQDMIKHVEQSNDMIFKTKEEISNVLEDVNKMFDIIEKKFQDIDALEQRITKASQNESVMSILNEGKNKKAKPSNLAKEKVKVSSSDKTPEPWNRKDAEAEIQQQHGDQAEEPKDKETGTEEATPKDKEGDTKVEATKYSASLKSVLNESLSAWNTTLGVFNSICGVRTKVTKEATSEFITVLTKFANTKS